jgi:hypothetical protein
MFLTQSTYRKILLIALTVFLAVPCTVKREFKQWLIIETNQHPKSENSRIACSSFVQQEKQITKLKAEKVILPNTISDFKNSSARIINKTQLTDFYTLQKEKIPSHLLFERFLI